MTLDVRSSLKQIGDALGLPADALEQAPADTGDDHDHELRPALGRPEGRPAIRILSVWLLVLVLALYAAAIYLAAAAAAGRSPTSAGRSSSWGSSRWSRSA